jgi:hypothetical protein
MKKTLKGSIAIFAILILLFCISSPMQSCKKSNNSEVNNNLEGEKFNKLCQSVSNKLVSISLTTNNNSLAKTESNTSNYETNYIDFPTQVTPAIQADFNNAESVQEMANIVSSTNSYISKQGTNNNINYAFQMDADQVRDSLASLVTAARHYLCSRGFTNISIDAMLQEEGVPEETLIPFVMLLTNSQATASKTLGECVIKALGGNALYSLAFSGAASWSAATMTIVFKAVAKRFLGPIGVAIAVVTFTMCMHGGD